MFLLSAMYGYVLSSFKKYVVLGSMLLNQIIFKYERFELRPCNDVLEMSMLETILSTLGVCWEFAAKY